MQNMLKLTYADDNIEQNIQPSNLQCICNVHIIFHNDIIDFILYT